MQQHHEVLLGQPSPLSLALLTITTLRSRRAAAILAFRTTLQVATIPCCALQPLLWQPTLLGAHLAAVIYQHTLR